MSIILHCDLGAGRSTDIVWRAVSKYVEEVGPARSFLCGKSKGPGFAGEAWLDVTGAPVERVMADYEKHGGALYYARAEEMAERAEGLIAIWDGWDRLTAHLIREVERRGKPAIITRVGTYEL